MSRNRSGFIFLAVLAAATIAVYLPGIRNELIFDDGRLTDGTIFGAYGNLLDLRPRMLPYGSFVWLQALMGPGWWKQRLFNVFLHLGVAYALYALFTQLLNATRFPEDYRTNPEFLSSRKAALRVGIAVFALNPVAVYAVAYLIQRSILMATLFVVLACLAWVQGLATGRYRWMGLALLCYLLAILSKEAAVAAVALAVPLSIFVTRPSRKRIALIVGASLAAALPVGWFLWHNYGSFLGSAFDESSRLFVRQLEALSPGVSAKLVPLSTLNQSALFFCYGLLWFVPNIQWMAIDLRPGFPLSLSAFPQLLGAAGFVAVFVGAAWLLLRRSNMLGFLGLCLLLPMLLYFSEFAIVWVQDPFVLYRSYLWALAVPGVIALPLIGLSPRVIYPVGVVIALLFGGLALERTFSLRNDLTVWSDAIEKIDLHANANAVGRWRPYVNRGAYYLDHGLPDYAYDDFVRAEALGETFGSARFNMGVSQQLMKRYSDALASFAKAESMGFNEPQLYYQRGESLQALGRAAEAYDSYTTALGKTLDAKLRGAIRLRRAEAAAAAARYDVAITEFNLLLKESPEDQRLMMGLGLAYVGKDDSASALAVFERMLAVHPTAAAYYGRGLAHVVGSDKAKALQDLDTAISLEPGNPLYSNMRARIAAQK